MEDQAEYKYKDEWVAKIRGRCEELERERSTALGELQKAERHALELRALLERLAGAIQVLEELMRGG